MPVEIPIRVDVRATSPRPLLSGSRSYLYKAEIAGEQITVEAVIVLDGVDRLEPGQSGTATLECLRSEAARVAISGTHLRVWYVDEFADAVVL